jgi:hypothetical protein
MDEIERKIDEYEPGTVKFSFQIVSHVPEVGAVLLASCFSKPENDEIGLAIVQYENLPEGCDDLG